MLMTLGQAAKAAGISKSTLSKAVQTGRVSARRAETGSFEIDPAELFRVYPANAGVFVANSSPEQNRTPSRTPSEQAETATLRAEIDGLKAQLRMMQGFVDDLKEDRDNWREQAKASQRLLEDQRPRRWRLFG